ncbi:class I SAM-dependent methyltransferase [Nisaea acidiphila]|uniref:Class I SAM-dependent methyltransferase n=1 Tax=Nisaea acidiphila TaxID=1862145 RepID=A0A9J7AU47_9PROT|nr:class I SAM-dependent methyltransferase [Nisaea acidiphila]UUX49844.1 class I SAM-dependent methyltransferase [Nisaea acidiphila]
MRDAIQEFYDNRPYPRFDGDLPLAGVAARPKATAAIHHGFGGVVPKNDPVRVLIAGGGSGMGLCLLAKGFEELGVDARFTYLDISPESRKYAEARSEAAGIREIEFRTGDINALSPDTDGFFDFIDFTGVINHVADAQHAVNALAGVLTSDGSISCMAYGRTGRTGIYDFQELIFRLLGPHPDIGIARAVLKTLPTNNWLRKSPLYPHLVAADDVEFADALLNPRDRAFSTGELEDIFATAGLEWIGFTPPILYDPVAILKSGPAADAAAGLSSSDRRRVAELLIGDLNKHFLFARRSAPRNALETALQDPNSELFSSGTIILPDEMQTANDGKITISVKTRMDGRERTVGVKFTAAEAELIGKLREPVQVGRLRADIGPSEFEQAFERVYRFLTSLDMLHVVARR